MSVQETVISKEACAGLDTRWEIINIQSTLVISKSRGPSETLRDIHASIYQICKIEENTNRTTKFHK